MDVKYKGHRTIDINSETIIVGLDWINSLQAFEPTVIAYFCDSCNIVL